MSQINTIQIDFEAFLYIEPYRRINEHPVVFISEMLSVSLDTVDSTFNAHAQKRHPVSL